MPMSVIAVFEVLSPLGYRVFKVFDAVKDCFLLCVHDALSVYRSFSFDTITQIRFGRDQHDRTDKSLPLGEKTGIQLPFQGVNCYSGDSESVKAKT